MSCAFLLMAVAAFGASVPTAAQTVRALVLDPTTNVPTGAGYVVIWDDTGTEVARTLNGEDGLVALRAPASGQYSAGSVRVGFQTTKSEPFTIAPEETVDLVLDIAHLPVDLPPLTGGDSCVGLGEATPAVRAWWTEVTKALTATQWSGPDGLDYYSIVYRRDLDPDARMVFAESTEVVQGLVLQHAVTPRFDAFVTTETGGALIYHVPDPAFLLSTRFAREYCIRTTRDPTRVGMTFERRTPTEASDVTGTLWIHPETGALQRIDYRYVNVPLPVGGERAGGHIVLTPGPSGRWLADTWELRTPLLAEADSDTPVLAGMRHAGGLMAGITRGQDMIYTAELTELTGTVVDSAGAVMAGAQVGLRGTDYTAVTDGDGRFRIAGPLAGEYAVAFTHPFLDAQGLFPLDTAVVLRPGEHRTLTLHAVAATDYLSALIGNEQTADQPDDRGRPLRSRNVIPFERLAEAQDVTVLEIINRLRPDWFRNRGTASFSGVANDPVVFRNAKYIGDVSLLGSIPVEQIREIRYFDLREATQRWGSRLGRPVIELLDRR